MEDAKVLLTFHRDTLELDIDAPDLTLDVVISIVERAKRMLENSEKVVIAQQMSQAVRDVAVASERTRKVISNLKM